MDDPMNRTKGDANLLTQPQSSAEVRFEGVRGIDVVTENPWQIKEMTVRLGAAER